MNFLRVENRHFVEKKTYIDVRKRLVVFDSIGDLLGSAWNL